MTGTIPSFAPFAERMQAAGLPDVLIRTFAHHYHQLAEGQTGLIREDTLREIGALPDLEKLPEVYLAAERRAPSAVVMIKLNGGLGTSMGLDRAKSLLQVRPGCTFLEVIARQAARDGLPLMLMNSFSTRQDTLEALRDYRPHDPRIPLDFLQHMAPKVLQADLSPATWPAEPELEWAPPGHGDLYVAIRTSGVLDALLAAGYRYAFVSNADNLGAVYSPQIAGYMRAEGIPFLMEVADRTESDNKGGHLARSQDGRLILRESAQCAEQDRAAFADITRHRYFNTNNLWLDLTAVRDLLERTEGVLDLPMIRNSKHLDPRDESSPMVYQLETAMGSAISLFPGATALRVPRSRFAPVKTTDDLLALRSDAYIMTDDYRVLPNPERLQGPPVVRLDPRFYRRIDDLDARFPSGAPSLLQCDALTVEGDVQFGRSVVCVGAVTIVNASAERRCIPDTAVLEGYVDL